MVSYLKIVGLLVVLSGLCGISYATAHETVTVPEKQVAAVTLQSAQSSVAAGATFRAIAGY